MPFTPDTPPPPVAWSAGGRGIRCAGTGPGEPGLVFREGRGVAAGRGGEHHRREAGRRWRRDPIGLGHEVPRQGAAARREGRVRLGRHLRAGRLVEVMEEVGQEHEVVRAAPGHVEGAARAHGRPPRSGRRRRPSPGRRPPSRPAARPPSVGESSAAIRATPARPTSPRRSRWEPTSRTGEVLCERIYDNQIFTVTHGSTVHPTLDEDIEFPPGRYMVTVGLKMAEGAVYQPDGSVEDGRIAGQGFTRGANSFFEEVR